MSARDRRRVLSRSAGALGRGQEATRDATRARLELRREQTNARRVHSEAAVEARVQVVVRISERRRRRCRWISRGSRSRGRRRAPGSCGRQTRGRLAGESAGGRVGGDDRLRDERHAHVDPAAQLLANELETPALGLLRAAQIHTSVSVRWLSVMQKQTTFTSSSL